MRRRRSPSRGWHRVAPRTKAERATMPAKCFLDSKRRKYPVCAVGSRKVDCRGVEAALARAAQRHHSKLVAKARRLGARSHCSWMR